MRNHRTRSVLVSVALTGALIGALSGCGGDSDKPDEAIPEVKGFNEIPGVVMIDKKWSTFATAKITKAYAAKSGKSLNVNYVAGPEGCSGFAGYATHRVDDVIEVTIVNGRDKGCTGKETNRATVLPIKGGISGSDVKISKYSRTSVNIG